LAHEAKERTPQQRPLLLLILNKEPPVLVQGKGRQSFEDAIMAGLREVISEENGISAWRKKIDETVGWITWHEFDQVVRRNFSMIEITDSSARGSISQLVQSITDSIQRHGFQNQSA
jgi:hypothetical protein